MNHVFDPNATQAPMNVAGQQHLNHGAVAIEQSRAMTEAQGKLLLAKQFPRDINRVYTALMNSCKRRSLAAVAFYSYPRGKETISGPSIRLAEEIARLYGNLDFGIRELSNFNGESEMCAYAWDLENNVISEHKFKVRHERSAYGSVKQLTDSRDIYELTANMAARRLRARLLAVLPPDLIDAAVEECRRTLAGNNEMPLQDRVRRMVSEFSKLGITQQMIEARLGHGIDETNTEEVIDFIGIYNSIKNGQSGRSDWFEHKVDATAALNTTAGDFSPGRLAKSFKQEQKVESVPVEQAATVTATVAATDEAKPAASEKPKPQRRSKPAEEVPAPAKEEMIAGDLVQQDDKQSHGDFDDGFPENF